MPKLLKNRAPDDNSLYYGTSVTIQNDGITVTQSTDCSVITSDTPIRNRQEKYAYEITLVNVVPKGSYKLPCLSVGIANSKSHPLYWIAYQSIGDSILGLFTNVDFLGHKNYNQYDAINGDTIGAGWDFKNTTLELFINGISKTKISIKDYYSLDFQNITQFPQLYFASYFYSQFVSSAEAKYNFGQEPHKYTYDGYIDPYYEIISDSNLKLY